MIRLITGLTYSRGYTPAMWLHIGHAMRQSTQRAVRGVLRKVPALIRKGVRERYTYKGAIKTQMQIWGDSGQVKVSGGRLSLDKFKTRGGLPRRGKKLYAMIVKGQGGTIERGFAHGWSVYKRMSAKAKARSWRYGEVGDVTMPDGFYQRTGASRLPIKRLYGPSVAEMAGKEPQPAKMIQQRIEELLSAQMGAMM